MGNSVRVKSFLRIIEKALLGLGLLTDGNHDSKWCWGVWNGWRKSILQLSSVRCQAGFPVHRLVSTGYKRQGTRFLTLLWRRWPCDLLSQGLDSESDPGGQPSFLPSRYGWGDRAKEKSPPTSTRLLELSQGEDPGGRPTRLQRTRMEQLIYRFSDQNCWEWLTEFFSQDLQGSCNGCLIGENFTLIDFFELGVHIQRQIPSSLFTRWLNF